MIRQIGASKVRWKLKDIHRIILHSWIARGVRVVEHKQLVSRRGLYQVQMTQTRTSDRHEFHWLQQNFFLT